MGMFTNGTLLSKFNLFKTLVTSLEWIRISIDAGNKNSYDNLRITNKQNNFDTVIANINELISYKKKLNSKITIGVGFVVTEKNYKEIIEFANLFNHIDVDYCQYKPEIISGQLKNNPNKIKFIKLINVPISLQVIQNNVIIELDLIESIIGFTFKKNEMNVEEIDYELLIKEKEYNIMANTFIFPKINKQTKSDYGKQFNLGKIHLGEILYGKMFDLDINTNLILEIKTSDKQ
jgi:hypothetical protein